VEEAWREMQSNLDDNEQLGGAYMFKVQKCNTVNEAANAGGGYHARSLTFN
jgi:hypothetical protein